MICYVTFAADHNVKEYGYTCGGLRPEGGDLVVVMVGKDNSLKIVTCTRVSNLPDPRATKEIFGIVQQQPPRTP